MSRYEFAKQSASTIMPILVDSKNGMVRFNSFAKLHKQLIALAFRYLRKEKYGPEGGWQVFYLLDLPESGLLVRIKTMGEPAGRPRAGVAHLSVAVTDGAGELWMDERAKLTKSGKLETKAMAFPKSDQNPRGFDGSVKDFQGNDHSFVTILGGKYEGAGQQAWADRVHFSFPENADFSTVAQMP
jgi:hypothetical protein